MHMTVCQGGTGIRFYGFRVREAGFAGLRLAVTDSTGAFCWFEGFIVAKISVICVIFYLYIGFIRDTVWLDLPHKMPVEQA